MQAQQINHSKLAYCVQAIYWGETLVIADAKYPKMPRQFRLAYLATHE
ncbi:MAG: D-ribose pyranose/furanose isomerase RbsD [Gammaproteobacteria bacterium]|jgi:D-ribose pyranose/furanose isomerase RbsD